MEPGTETQHTERGVKTRGGAQTRNLSIVHDTDRTRRNDENEQANASLGWAVRPRQQGTGARCEGRGQWEGARIGAGNEAVEWRGWPGRRGVERRSADLEGRARGGRQVGSRLREVGGDRRVHEKGREISARGKPECLGWCEATETDSTARDVLLLAGIVPASLVR